MKVEHITSLLEFCLQITYFQFQGNFYEKISGAAMGSPISPIVANLFMEEFEVRAIQTAKNPPKMWKRYVDDTCVILKSANKEEFFHHRAKTVCTTKQSLEKEDHLFTALRRCKYPVWAWNRTNFQKKQKKTIQGAINNNKTFIVVPYMKGLAESCKNICRRYGVEVYFKGGRTIRDILVHPKDKDTILKKSGVIYKYSCGRVDCGEEYIGESGRTFGERYREPHEVTITHHGPSQHHRP